MEEATSSSINAARTRQEARKANGKTGEENDRQITFPMITGGRLQCPPHRAPKRGGTSAAGKASVTRPSGLLID